MRSRKINESNHKKVILRNSTFGFLKMIGIKSGVWYNQPVFYKDYSDFSVQTEGKFGNQETIEIIIDLENGKNDRNKSFS